MPVQDDERERILEEELPGSSELESALITETITDAVSYQPLVLDENSSLREVLNRLREHGHGCAVLVSGERLTGIFTERDVVQRVAGREIDLDNTAVKSVMTHDPTTVPADSNVAYALNLMIEEGFRHVPVVDDDGRPTAVVSMRNLIEFLSDFFRKELMTLPPDPKSSFRQRDGA